MKYRSLNMESTERKKKYIKNLEDYLQQKTISPEVTSDEDSQTG